MSFKFNFFDNNTSKSINNNLEGKFNAEIIDFNCDDTLGISSTSPVGLKYLSSSNYSNISEIHPAIVVSDLIPDEYEGGYKIWECTYDLYNYLKNMDFCKKHILDLGCGSGFLGILALMNNAEYVTFQDYNKDVLQNFTMPNIKLNIDTLNDKCHFVAGDWISIIEKNMLREKFDVILTSETIYNPQNNFKLYELLKHSLKTNGQIFVAAKSHYFGIGGSVKSFLALVDRDNYFNYNICWKSIEGVPRLIIHLK